MFPGPRHLPCVCTSEASRVPLWGLWRPAPHIPMAPTAPSLLSPPLGPCDLCPPALCATARDGARPPRAVVHGAPQAPGLTGSGLHTWDQVSHAFCPEDGYFPQEGQSVPVNPYCPHMEVTGQLHAEECAPCPPCPCSLWAPCAPGPWAPSPKMPLPAACRGCISPPVHASFPESPLSPALSSW